MKKNDILTVNVTDINHMGLGVARCNGAVIFVQGGVTGDVAEVKIIKEAKNYYVARIEQLTKPSEHRQDASCPSFKRCGGCIYQLITPEYERVLKESRVKNEFKRFGVDCKSFEPLISVRTTGYRNKLQCPVSEDGKMGFYAQKTHEVIDTERCELQESLTEGVYSYLRRFVSSHPQSGIRHIYLRAGVGTGEVMVCFVCRGESFKGQSEAVKALSERFPEVKSVILNVNPDDTNVVLGKKCITLFGKGYIEDELCGLRFKIDPLSFYQVNHDCTELMYRLAAEMAEVKPTDTLVDLFCGIGTIGLCVSSIAPVKRLIGVEVVPEAIENAKENAALNGISNAEFYCSAAEDFDFGEPDVLIVDPPRKGLAPSLIDTIGRVAPKRIVYISCSPDTLARDCSMLDKFGYKVLRCRPVNMFPRTGHVESVVCLTRSKL